MDSNLSRASEEIVRLWWVGERQSRALRTYRRLRVLTDALLDHLERLNLEHPGEHELDVPTRRAIESVLGQVPEPLRPALPPCRTVQEALDSWFELKSELHRRVHPTGAALDWSYDSETSQVG
jgi:hypothetical protein